MWQDFQLQRNAHVHDWHTNDGVVTLKDGGVTSIVILVHEHGAGYLFLGPFYGGRIGALGSGHHGFVVRTGPGT